MLFYIMELIFTGVLLKVLIGLVKIDFLVFVVCSLLHSLLHSLLNSLHIYVSMDVTEMPNKSIFANPIQMSNSTTAKLSSMAGKVNIGRA